MNLDLWRPVAASVFRHLITVACGAVFVQEHDNEIAAVASLLVAMLPIAWGARNARRNAIKTKSVNP